MRVFIPTAGTGSRLGSLTSNINKSLISINNKPVISYIIESYPKKTEFVIALGYQGSKVKEFLKLFYPKYKFIFIYIKNFSGVGSGLRLTLLNSKHKLQRPFIFHACDSIITNKVYKLNSNWVGCSTKGSAKNYRQVELKRKLIREIKEKSKSEILKPLNYIGLAGVHNYKSFWKNIIKTKKNFGEVSGLNGLLEYNLKPKKFDWYDVGNLESLKKTRNKFEKKKNNILEKVDESIWFLNNKVIKFSNDQNFIKHRVLRSKLLYPFTPKVKSKSKHYYIYNSVKGIVYSKKANLSNFKLLLKFLEKFWQKKKFTKKFKVNCYQFYKNKTYKRILNYLRINNLKDKTEYINNIKIPPILRIISELNWNNLSNGKPVNFHGDLHFENILISKKMKFTLLDWRQNFNKSIIVGDIYYDFAKILHGLIISHEKVVKDEYKVRLNDKKKELKIFIKNDYKKIIIYFENWITNNGYDLNKTRILTALIFINIATLHEKNYGHFLFSLGKLLLNDLKYFNRFSK